MAYVPTKLYLRMFVLRFSAIIFFISFMSEGLISQNLEVADIRSTGMANTGVALSGSTPFHVNPAVSGQIPSTILGITCYNSFRVSELNTISCGIVLPTLLGSFGLTNSFFGTTDYNEQNYSLAYSKLLGSKLLSGIRFNYWQTNLNASYDPARVFTGDLGILIKPLEQLSIGATIRNLTNARFIGYPYEKITQSFTSGATWTEDVFILTAQVELSSDQPAHIGVGSEFSLVNDLDIRIGASTREAMKYTFGLGYRLKKVQTDIAFAFHPMLGFSTYLGIYYIFGKNRP